MIPLLADENFNEAIIRGLFRREPDLDLVTIIEAGLSGADDPSVLEFAAKTRRVPLTHDVTTITGYAYERIQADLPMPGVLEVRQSLAVGVAIEDILIFAECSEAEEWEGQIVYLPL